MIYILYRNKLKRFNTPTEFVRFKNRVGNKHIKKLNYKNKVFSLGTVFNQGQTDYNSYRRNMHKQHFKPFINKQYESYKQRVEEQNKEAEDAVLFGSSFEVLPILSKKKWLKTNRDYLENSFSINLDNPTSVIPTYNAYKQSVFKLGKNNMRLGGAKIR